MHPSSALSILLVQLATIAHAQPFLSSRFEEELGTQEWRRVFGDVRAEWYAPPSGQPLAIRLLLRDEDNGRESVLTPAVFYEVDGRHRWGGHALGIDWVLVLDGLAPPQAEMTATLQVKATTPRRISASIGVVADVDHARWHRDFFSSQDLDRAIGEISDTLPAPYGDEGRMARWPFGVLELPNRTLLAMVDTSEPRILQIVARPTDHFFGVRYHAVLTPGTTSFPGRAVFRCRFSSWASSAGESAFRQAVSRLAASGDTAVDPRTAPPASFPFSCVTSTREQTSPDWSRWWPFTARTVDAVVFDEQTSERMAPENTDVQRARMRAGNRAVTLRYHPAVESDALRSALYWGMQPEMEPGANISDTAQVAEIRSLATRLAHAGWQTTGPLHTHAAGVSMEHFGAPDSPVRQITLYNRNPWPVWVTLEMRGGQGLWLLADPQRGGLALSSVELPNPTWSFPLPARAVETRDYFALPDLLLARANLDAVETDSAGLRSLRSNMDSLTQELNLDVVARVHFPTLDDSLVRMQLANAGTQTVIVSDAALEDNGRRTTLIDQPFSLQPGQRRDVTAYLSDPPGGAVHARIEWRLSGVTTSVWAKRSQQLDLLPTLAGWCDVSRIASADEQIEIPVRVVNLGDTRRTVRARLARDRSAAFSPVLVAGRGETQLNVRVPRDPAPRNPLTIELTSNNRPFYRHDCTVDFLSDEDSLARDSRVRIEPSSTRMGYKAATLADGITRHDSDNPWNSSWCSEDIAAPHAVRMRFPQPTAISELRLHWPEVQGAYQTARAIQLVGFSSDGRSHELVGATRLDPTKHTSLIFESVQVEGIELQMPAGGGAVTSPNLLWLCEMEVR